MEKLIIKGGTPLKGTVKISGAKNAAVAILPATILINGKCRIDNLPNTTTSFRNIREVWKGVTNESIICYK